MNQVHSFDVAAQLAAANPVGAEAVTPADIITQLKHPIMSKTIVLPTRPINELVSSLRRVVMLREQGCCFSATSGFGKSFGLAMAEAELRSLFPAVPIFRHIINKHQVPSVRAFFKHFLLTVGGDNIKGETYDLRVRLLHRLIDHGRTSPLKLVVLLIDEAQEMVLQDFKFLKDIGNEMEKVEVQLVVIMMGQDPEFGETIAKLREAGHLDLVSRFTLRQLKFRGLKTRDDFASLLGLIDRQCYPSTSSCTWPQFFAPRLWEGGFRMQAEADRLMAAIASHMPEGLSTKGVPARQLFLAIRRFLVDLCDVDGAGESVPDDLWDAAIEYALVEEAVTIAFSEGPRKTRRKGVKL